MIFRKMYYGRPVRNALYALTETFWRKQFFWKVRIVWIVSEYERNLMAGGLKLASNCPVERFDEKPIFGETSYLWWGIHTLGKTFLTFYGRNWQDCQNSIFRLRWNMLKKKCFTWKSFEVLIKFGFWTKEIHSKCNKPEFLVSRATFWWKILFFWGKTFSLSFLASRDKSSAGLSNKLPWCRDEHYKVNLFI